MLGNTFGVIPFESSKISLAQIPELRSTSIEVTPKEWIFYIVDDLKSFRKPECSVTQSSAMSHSYKWEFHIHIQRFNFIFNDSIVPNKQPWNSKIDCYTQN